MKKKRHVLSKGKFIVGKNFAELVENMKSKHPLRLKGKNAQGNKLVFSRSFCFLFDDCFVLRARFESRDAREKRGEESNSHTDWLAQYGNGFSYC